MIPKKLHQIWIGGKMPKQYEEWVVRFARLNPEWEHYVHGNELIEHYARDPFVAWMRETNERTAFLVDRLRVLLLRDEGGVYFDVDCYPLRSLTMLNDIWVDPKVDFVCGMRPPDRRGVALQAPGLALIDNTVLGSAKGGEMINRLCALYRGESRRHTGFSMGKEIMRNAGPNTRILSHHYFYSDHDNPMAICLHDNNNLGSWVEPPFVNATRRS